MRWSQNFGCSGVGFVYLPGKKQVPVQNSEGTGRMGDRRGRSANSKVGCPGEETRRPDRKALLGDTCAHFGEVSCTGLLWNQEPELWGEWGQVRPAGLRSIWQQAKCPEAGRASSGMMTDTVPQTVLFSKCNVQTGMGNEIITVPKEESEPLRSSPARATQ